MTADTTLPYPPPWQDLATLAKHICAGERTIERWVKEGVFPGPRKRVKGKNLWWWKEVEEHLAGDAAKKAPSPPSRKPGDITNAGRAATNRH